MYTMTFSGIHGSTPSAQFPSIYAARAFFFAVASIPGLTDGIEGIVRDEEGDVVHTVSR